jgi:hypothetical protein
VASNIVKITLLNYEELLDGGRAIIEASAILGLPEYLTSLWVLSYLRVNIKVGIE